MEQNPIDPHGANAPSDANGDKDKSDHLFCSRKIFYEKTREKLKRDNPSEHKEKEKRIEKL